MRGRKDRTLYKKAEVHESIKKQKSTNLHFNAITQIYCKSLFFHEFECLRIHSRIGSTKGLLGPTSLLKLREFLHEEL